MPKTPPRRFPIETVIGGTTFTGDYSINSGVVTVYYAGHSKSTQIGASGVDTIARLLLTELVRSSK